MYDPVYQAEYRRKNKEHLAAYKKAFYSIPENRERKRQSDKELRMTKPARERKNAYSRAYYEANREKYREYMRKAQKLPCPTRPMPDLCENCEKPPNGKGCLHLDHDHKTGKFRGWLCSTCNTGLGKLGDSIEGLERAIGYLTRAKSTSPGTAP